MPSPRPCGGAGSRLIYLKSVPIKVEQTQQLKNSRNSLWSAASARRFAFLERTAARTRRTPHAPIYAQASFIWRSRHSSINCRPMRSVLLILLLILPAASAQEASAPITLSPARQTRDQRIAARFAPVIYQGLGDQPRADYITNFDFDGDWKGDNNWRNADNRRYPLRGFVYFSVIETTTHFFIHYATFHPRDYKGGLRTSSLVDALLTEGLRRVGKDPTGGLADDVALSHENDLEGCLVVAEKENADSVDGTIQMVETVAHNQFLRYRAPDYKTAVGDTVDLKDGHPVLFAEPKGHGLSRYTGFREQLKKSVGGTLIYVYSGRADDPETTRDKTIGYDLIPIYSTLWQQAQTGENETYGEAAEYQKFTLSRPSPSDSAQSVDLMPGKLGAAFRGTVGFKNKARPPWGWFDENEKDRPKGEWFFDPASVIARHFNLGGSFSRVYVYHPYFRIGLP